MKNVEVVVLVVAILASFAVAVYLGWQWVDAAKAMQDGVRWSY